VNQTLISIGGRFYVDSGLAGGSFDVVVDSTSGDFSGTRRETHWG
jgi:hypothetical protein